MGLGFLEIVVIGVAALVLLGPQRIPEIMRHVARFYVQLRRTSNDFKSTFDHVLQEAEVELKKEELSQLVQRIKEVQTDIKQAAQEQPDPPASEKSQDTSLETPILRPEKPFGWDAHEEAPTPSSDSAHKN